MGGSRYFVIFVDDFSRYTWIYFFKNRSELYQIYRDFTKMIETQFSKPIKVFRSDNAQEYKPMNLPLFYINLVLFLIPLVQALLSKNGRAEHKLRHILDVVRATTISASTPSQFWREACKTRENSNFLKRGKMVISIKIRNFYRSWMTKRTSLLGSSREI